MRGLSREGSERCKVEPWQQDSVLIAIAAIFVIAAVTTVVTHQNPFVSVFGLL